MIDPKRVLPEAELTEALKTLPGWELKDGAVRRKYKTDGWPHSVMLSTTLAFLSDAAWHHPDIRTSYLEVAVSLKSHDVNAITMRDIELAHKFDEVALWLPPEGGALEGYERGMRGKKNWIK
jgi:4a-hydroxytetrahydrobiopterin dehydratase